MARVKFTAARVRDFVCQPDRQQSFLWDSEAVGLALRATAKGAKAYVFQARLAEREMRVTIGAQKDWDVAHAREEARRLQRLLDAGKDPRVEKAAAMQAEREAAEAKRAAAQRDVLTVGEAWEAYLHHLRTSISPKTKKARSARYLADHEALAAPGGEQLKRGKGKTVRGPLASLMALRLSDLTAARVAAWLDTEAATRPTNAAHAFRLLRAFMTWAADHDAYAGVVDTDACTSRKVTGQVPQSKAKPGGVLQREQLHSWFAAVRQLDNPIHSAYLQAVLICGGRREELAHLRWRDVDFTWNTLHLRDKVETEVGRIIPLPPHLRSLLACLPRVNDWVFSSVTAASGRLQEPRYAHDKALAAAGLPHLTLHDLRRSFKTLSEWCELPAGITAQLMGHKASALVERHYTRRSVDLLRVWHVKFEQWLLTEAKIEFDPAAAPQTGLHAVK
ncbi:hypothetical protein R69619_03739 [Paraburkholderia nemoris]|uniref:tyrosine-type recombinase/integrase n=1 Tax=Paraburkholderia nemoris TaxID=2793076 RepID=UPI00190BA5E2|nr:integrase family protein [Paraburkholderia nemoris]MBK3743152.1 tyrosine-type recombinase/integrase [Paraburkholderia aspalathi]CAE6768686.1 hypothetical protein R69619_03739 [Paraburkholderia nemoris]